MTSHEPSSSRPLSIPLAILPLIFLVALLAFIISLFGSDSLSGGSQIALLLTSGLCYFLARVTRKTPWETFEKAITRQIAGVAPAILLLMFIGALSGCWMISGVVPTLIYYGMQILHPSFFLVSCCIICALVSTMTGSSWTTVATIGIALIGIGRAQGFDDGWIAGAIISGAYFGDKISPLSDTTVLASSTARVPLFQHIRYLFITTIPALLIALTVFTIAGLMHSPQTAEQTAAVAVALKDRFCITPWLLLVPVATGILIAKRVPPIVTLFLSALLAIVFALIFQREALYEIAALPQHDGWALLKGSLITTFGNTQLQSPNHELAELIATRGMAGMLGTIWLILCAMCFGGSMIACGIIETIGRAFRRLAQKRTSMVSSTVGGGLFFNTVTADQYLSIILTIELFRDIYERNGYESRLLSRTAEDSVTVTSPLIPWNTCGMTQATVLNVPTLTYLPYCVFNYVCPMVSIVIAATGYKIFRRTQPAGATTEPQAARP